ncbi:MULTISPECIES: hypothetical protein [Amycolatopsis]|uniref:Uncharacterized protein n=1 Tax=Amycolatopsis albidoflavus TaxID=102226 RepID=A0ABW5HYC1_9PSEU
MDEAVDGAELSVRRVIAEPESFDSADVLRDTTSHLSIKTNAVYIDKKAQDDLASARRDYADHAEKIRTPIPAFGDWLAKNGHVINHASQVAENTLRDMKDAIM